MPHWFWAIIIVLVILLLLFLVFCAYAGNFLITAALFRDSTLYATKGHKMLNHDNFNTKKTVWTEIEDRQNKERDEFWHSQPSESWKQELAGHQIVATAFKNTGHRWVIGVHGYRSTGKRDMATRPKSFLPSVTVCSCQICPPMAKAAATRSAWAGWSTGT